MESSAKLRSHFPRPKSRRASRQPAPSQPAFRQALSLTTSTLLQSANTHHPSKPSSDIHTIQHRAPLHTPHALGPHTTNPLIQLIRALRPAKTPPHTIPHHRTPMHAVQIPRHPHPHLPIRQPPTLTPPAPTPHRERRRSKLERYRVGRARELENGVQADAASCAAGPRRAPEEGVDGLWDAWR